jgi:nitrous oxide reductase
MKDKTKTSADRRRFLKMAGLGAAVTGAAVGLAGRPVAAAQPAASGKTAAGYRETEHVKRYYALARM